MKLQFIFTGLFYFSFSYYVYAGDIFSDVPSKPGAAEKYVFYLHGSAEEADGDNDKYQASVEAIADNTDNVITEVRGDTDPNTYALKVKKQVALLLDKGIPAKNITISGFSKGSIISLAVAGILNNSKINYVLLAGCSEDLNEKYDIKTSKLTGRILSLYDSDDEKFGSCEDIIKPSANVIFEETDLESGKGHKLFRIPKEKFIEQWRDPLISWTDA